MCNREIAKDDPYRRCVHRYLMRRFNKQATENTGFETIVPACNDGDAMTDATTYAECLWRNLDSGKLSPIVETTPPPPPEKKAGSIQIMYSAVLLIFTMLI